MEKPSLRLLALCALWLLAAPAVRATTDEGEGAPGGGISEGVTLTGEGVVYDSGELATLVDRGCGGNDASRLQTDSLGMGLYGVSASVPYRVAEDFTLTEETTINRFVFYALQASSGTTCTIDDVRFIVWDDSPAGFGAPIFGDLVTNKFESCEFSGVYRDSESSPGACDQPVMAVTATVNQTLPAGTYWVDFQLDGTLLSSVYAPLITVLGETSACPGGCNAIRYNSTFWEEIEDSGQPQGVKIVVAADAMRTIRDGNATFARRETPFDPSPSASLRGVGPIPTGNTLYETGWAYRVSGDASETFFAVPDSENYAGDTSTLLWLDVDSRGLFAATETSQIEDTGLGAVVRMEMELENLSPSSTLTLELFHATDIDAGGTFLSDEAEPTAWTPGRIVTARDPNGGTVDYWADAAASGYRLEPWNDAADVFYLLADGNVDNFTNTGAPFGPDDLTAGYQFHLEIPPLATRSVVVRIGANSPLPCGPATFGLYCDGLEFGGPDIWSQVEP